MLETTLRIVRPGAALYVWVRHARVTASDQAPDLLQRACGRLRNQHGLAAVPAPGESSTLLVATREPVPSLRIEEEDWVLELVDSGQPARRLTLTDSDAAVVPLLIERAFEVTLDRQTDLWSFDSLGIWYEPEPFIREQGIVGYRRYEVSALALDGIGLGLSVDMGTAFFSEQTMAYFFDWSLPLDEQERRKQRLFALMARQEGQKGTLLYDNGNGHRKCYFESAPHGSTAATTGLIRVKGRTFGSLHEYYRSRYPALHIAPDAVAVRVSFFGLDRPQWVAARLLRARVMNEHLPESMQSVDKLSPNDRRSMVMHFWNRFDANPLGRVAPGLYDGLWRPSADRIEHLPVPTLTFGNGKRLDPPAESTTWAVKAHYRQRQDYLQEAGCHEVPPAMVSALYCAYPSSLDAEVARQLASDLADHLGRLVQRPMTMVLVPYQTVGDALDRLRQQDTSGMVVFVLNDEASAYYETAYGLPEWRIKRITTRVLCDHYRKLTHGAWDRRTRQQSLERGQAAWDSFISMNVLAVAQLLDVVPYRLDQAGPYEAQLVIDVGYDRRHFALSLLIAREPGVEPSFIITSHVHVKADHKQEVINPIALGDQIVHLFDEAVPHGVPGIGSLLILRDGRLCGRELEGIDSAVGRLREQGSLLPDAPVDLAELHKNSQKPVRLWEVDEDGKASNPLEGTLILLGAKRVLVATTGAATLHQGTAEPFIVNANGRCRDIRGVAHAAFASAQLNWSSTAVAQRLPLPLKRTDEELAARAAQEIKNLR